MATSPTFSPVCSRNRLRFIQALCHKRTTDPRAVQEKPSVLLVLPGEDGRYNAGSQALLKYLLLGACGNDLKEATVDFQDQPLEDIALAITEDGVAVFRPSNLPDNTNAILNLWRNVRGHEVLEADTELREEVELYKIKSFIDMVEGHEYVGVALTGGWSRDDKPKPPSTYDQFEVESWPLVQAFGIADFGTGGFFTMKHRVLNVSEHLSSIYSHIDAHVVKGLLGEVVPALEQHWSTSMQVLDVIRSRPRRLGIVEEVIADALVTHYEFGRLRSAKLPGRGARVLFGTRTNDQKATASTARIGTSGIGGTSALHMTVEAEDPVQGVRVARTYFFRGGHVANLPQPRRLVAQDDNTPVSEAAGEAESKGSVATEAATDVELSISERHLLEPGTTDARYLMALYDALLVALKRAVAVLEDTTANLSAAASTCLEAVFDVFAPPDSGEPLLPYEFDLGENLDVSVQFADAFGDTVDSATASSGHRRLLVYIKVALHNVPSKEVDGEVLGAVVAGDTVLVGEGHTPTIVTRRIPQRSFWTTAEVETAANSAIDRALSSHAFRAEVLGVGVPQGEPLHHAMMALSSPSWPVAIEGTLRLFDGGFAMMTPRQAPVVVSIAAHAVSVRVVPAETAARCVGLALPGSLDADCASASWAEGPAPTAARAEADGGDVLVVELNDTASFVPGSKFVGLILSRGSGIKFSLVDMLSKWQHVISQRETDSAALAHAAGDGESDWAAQTRAAMGDDAPAAKAVPATWSGSDLPAQLHEGYRAATYRAWQWDFESRRLVEDVLVADAFRGCSVAPETYVDSSAAASDADASVASDATDSATVPVVILTGAPGSGKSRVASALVGFSNDEYVWELVQQPLSSGITFDAVALQTDVRAALKRVAARATRDRPGCIAVVAAGYADVVAVASAITAVDGVHVAACVGCVHMLNLHRDERRTQWLPRMMEQFSRGWATHAAFLGCEDVDVGELDRMKAVVRQCNPDVSILRLTGGLGRTITLGAGSITDIVKCGAFLKSSAVAFRNLACPGWHLAHTTAEYVASATRRQASVAEELERMGEAMQTRRTWRDSAAAIDGVQPLSPSIGAVHVTTGAVFVERRLRKVLANLVRLCKDPVAFVLGITERTGDGELSLVDTDTSRQGLEVWRVKGFVRVVDPANADQPARLFQVDAVPGVVRMHDVESRQAVGASTTSELLFVGQNLSRDKLVARLYRARPRRLARRQRRTVASLTADEKASIRKANLNAPLPPGTWFDGHQYMDHTGIPTPDHPLLSRFFEEYVARQNAEVEAHNSAVEAQTQASAAEAAGTGSAGSWWVANSDLGDDEDAAQQAVLRHLAHCVTSDSDLEDLGPVTSAQTAAAAPRPPTASTPKRGVAPPAVPSSGARARRRAGAGKAQSPAAAPLPRVAYGRARTVTRDADEDGVAESKGQAV